MKRKLLGLLIILGLLSIFPIYRYYTNANIFAKAVLEHASTLGKWSTGSISSNYSGEITINNVTFTPNGYKQNINFENAVIKTDPLFLLKSDPNELNYMLPETLSLSVNSAILGSNASDLYDSLKEDSMWMVLAGFAGSFGCDRNTSLSFNTRDWENILSKDQLFNLDLFYSRQSNGSLDVDLIIDAENQFSATWSSNLKQSYKDPVISLNELIVEKLYYNYLDYGFNLKRNNACMKNYSDSFAKYRLSSAEHIQNYLRTHFAKELPPLLISWYQRMLAPDVEYNAIFSLKERQYLNTILDSDQINFYQKASVEVASTDNKFIPITLKEIDFTAIDSELLKRENLKRSELEKQAKTKKQQFKKNPYAPIIHTIGFKKSKKVSLSQISSIINKRVRIKTKRGRPISGYIRAEKNGVITIETNLKIGSAQFTLEVKQISSIELIR